MTADMSISLKVLNIAAVFCASFRRSAMRLRKRDMRTLSSRAWPWSLSAPLSAPLSGRAFSAGAEGDFADGAEADFSDGEAASAMAASTSAFRMRPSLPVPLMEAGSRLFSAISLRTAGESAPASPVSDDSGDGVDSLSSSCFLASGSAESSLAPSESLAEGAEPASTCPRIVPTSTLSPSSTRTSESTPSLGA